MVSTVIYFSLKFKPFQRFFQAANRILGWSKATKNFWYFKRPRLARPRLMTVIQIQKLRLVLRHDFVSYDIEFGEGSDVHGSGTSQSQRINTKLEKSTTNTKGCVPRRLILATLFKLLVKSLFLPKNALFTKKIFAIMKFFLKKYHLHERKV